jgi:hypothetical protein
VAEYINNELAHDTYQPDMELGPIMADDTAATITVSDNPALMQFLVGKGGNVHWTDEREWAAPAGASIINSFRVSNIKGVRFRNAIAGLRARIICTLASADDADPIFEAGLLSAGAIASTGAVSATAAITGTVSAAGAAVGGTGFTANRTGVGTYQITFTTPFPAPPTVIPAISTDGTTQGQVNVVGLAAGQITIETTDSTGALADRGFMFLAFATQ